MFFPFLECRVAVAVSKKFKQSVNPCARSWCLRGRHMAIPKVDKSLTKGFTGNSGERQKREWPHKHWLMVGLGGLEPPTSPLSVLRSRTWRYRFFGEYVPLSLSCKMVELTKLY